MLHVPHLNYRIYKAFQDFVQNAYRNQRRIIRRALASHSNFSATTGVPPAKVLELACGGGCLAAEFPAESYVGIDGSLARIEAAKASLPTHDFRHLDVYSEEASRLLSESDFVFCFGLLHHLSDDGCVALLSNIERSLRRPGSFLAIEPTLPPFWANPAGFAISKMDEGEFIRPAGSYKKLFRRDFEWADGYTLSPRLPVSCEAFLVRF